MFVSWNIYFQAIEMSDTPVPDMICLCGRIYKDKFVQSEYQDQDALKHATEWYEFNFITQGQHMQDFLKLFMCLRAAVTKILIFHVDV